MKKTGICPKCDGAEVGRFAYVADENDATTEPGRKRTLWWQREGGGLFSSGTEHRADVEAYVCTACGYFEEYVANPEKVAWDKLAPFRWHRPKR